ncbi:MAG: DUF1223 domain-containing protein [Acidobacteria bacterium]|nr:DUF1223 domain-containing protein [Acidobacteriota bacterium]
MKLQTLLLAATIAATAQTRSPILLELFTSEGCSSCPPADRLLESLDQQPVSGADLIVLGEHVDYWDGSWKDRFSSPAFTKRQWAYAKYFGLSGVYTPQLVVDGQSEFVGSHGGDAKSAIQKALMSQKHPVTLKARSDGNTLKASVHVDGLSSKGATVFLALAESQAQSNVTRGENAGRHLKHIAVVRSLQAIGDITNNFEKELELTLPKNLNGLRVVAFIQDKATGRVLGVAQEKLSCSIHCSCSLTSPPI